MTGGTGADPFAIHTMVSGGEEVAHGDPSVTDEQRAAAGRETVAERTRALLPGNRRRAAAAYAAGGLPDGAEILRVWYPRDAAELLDHLGDEHFALWATDDVLHLLWRGTAERVILGGGVSVSMWPVADCGGLWEASLRVRRLDEAVIMVLAIGLGAAEPISGRPVTDLLTWRGARAPQDVAAEGPLGPLAPLAGEVREHVLDSTALRGPRALSVYVPPAAAVSGPLPGCVLADGQSAATFARVLEPAILSGATPPVLLVGVHNASDPANRAADLRGQEYLPRRKPRRFAAHLSFVTGEVIPWARSEFGVAEGPWIAAGFSNGAAWAIAAGQRRPEVFGGVAGFSAGIVPQRVAVASHGVRHYLAAGTLEEGFRRSTAAWAGRLRRAGVPCTHREWVGGHDQFWWQRSLPEALGWLLGGSGAATAADAGEGRGGEAG
jgi:enterochelin esterase-like enzyme